MDRVLASVKNNKFLSFGLPVVVSSIVCRAGSVASSHVQQSMVCMLLFSALVCAVIAGGALHTARYAVNCLVAVYMNAFAPQCERFALLLVRHSATTNQV